MADRSDLVFADSELLNDKEAFSTFIGSGSGSS